MQTLAPAFPALENLAPLVRTDAHEGPVYVAGEDALYFTTTGGSVRRLQLDSKEVSEAAVEVVAANGMALDLEGGLVVCEQGSAGTPAAIRRYEAGRTKTVVDSWRGLPLNSPNDVVVKNDGTIWFTDPSYGFLQGFRPEPQLGDYVYRFDPVGGGLDLVADSLDKPNGLAFSPDEQTLYVGDSGANHEPGSYDPARPHHILAFDVVDGRRLGPGRLFAAIAPDFPDGLKVDDEGRVYSSSFSGVQVLGPLGDFLGEIELPGAVDFTFGGSARNFLFITTDDAIWAAALDATAPTTDEE